MRLKKFKRFLAAALCGAVLLSGNAGVTISNAEEITEIETDVQETEQVTEDKSEKFDVLEDVDSFEISDDTTIDTVNNDIVGTTYMDEAVTLKYNTKINHEFDKSVVQRKVYKITIGKDAIISYKGKAYVDCESDDWVSSEIYDDEGNILLKSRYTIKPSMGFESFDESIYLKKGVYYLIFTNAYDGMNDLGNSRYNVVSDSISFTADLEYPLSNEIENNDNLKNAQKITPGTTQYGVMTYGDYYDSYKFNVGASGDLKVDFEGYKLNNDRAYNIGLYDSDGNEIEYKYGEYGSEPVEINITKNVEPGTYYIQIYSHEQGYYQFDVTVPEQAKDVKKSNTSNSNSYVDMYRLYNPNSGEHFYTSSTKERDKLSNVGWKYEGIAWKAPALSDIPVYRLYNPNAGDHHYTTSAFERDNLENVGWKYEGIGWYSTGSDGQALYRLYNPNAKAAGSHHYTTSASERDNLVSLGWRDEGVAWYGGK
ncbi:MAG: PPC domain-containing protein [Lachnospiraceae bacterium]|nr:PPC domain-containing protein [Lachnospiraceae bacterium]